jgi:hypothetical protein
MVDFPEGNVMKMVNHTDNCLFCRKPVQHEKIRFCSERCEYLWTKITQQIEEWNEAERTGPSTFYARDKNVQHYQVAGQDAYLIRCVRCGDKTLWMKGCTWKLDCHCTLLWTLKFDKHGKPFGVGRKQKTV